MKNILIYTLILFTGLLNAQNKFYKTSSDYVNDFVVHNHKVYVAVGNNIEVFNWDETDKLITQINFDDEVKSLVLLENNLK